MTSSVALSLQKNVYVKLREKYENNKWNLKELNWICTMINIGSSLVDPYEFFENQYAYLTHIQNCYFLENID